MVRLAHGWRLTADAKTAPALIREFIRPAVRAIPGAMARQVGRCQVRLAADLSEARAASKWTATGAGLDIEIATRGREPHDIAMELLLCLGQALWQKLTPDQFQAYWRLLDAEVRSGVPGEIDEDAFREKRALLRSASSASSRSRLERYGRASFAGTAAEYVHCLWHEVRLVSGRRRLPPQPLRRRLNLLSRWFPPARGYRLYPAA